MKDRSNRNHHILAYTGLLSLILSAGCAGPQVREPTVSRTNVERIQGRATSFSGFEVEAEVAIPPAAGSARVAKEATYEILVGDDLRPMANGSIPLTEDIPAEGGIVPLKASSEFTTEENLAEVLLNDAPISFIFRGSVILADGDAFEFSKAGHVRSPRVPGAEIWHVEASSQSGTISLIFFVRIRNENPFQLQFNHLNFALAIEGKTMVENGRAGSQTLIPASANAELRIEYELNEQNFPGVGDVIKAKRAMNYLIDGDIQLAVGHIPIEFDGTFNL